MRATQPTQNNTMEPQSLKEEPRMNSTYQHSIEPALLWKLKEVPSPALIAELHANPEFWQFLIKKLKIIDVFILELLYVPQSTATYMQDVVNRIGKYNLKRTAVRNRLNNLERLGLIKLNRSSLTCVNSIPDLETNVKKLIICCKMRFGW